MEYYPETAWKLQKQQKAEFYISLRSFLLFKLKQEDEITVFMCNSEIFVG